MPKKCDIAVAHVVVSLVVVSFAKTPFRAAHPPLTMAYMSHCVLRCAIKKGDTVKKMEKVDGG